MYDTSRRAFLSGGGTIAVGGLVGLSGCLDTVLSSDEEDRESNERDPLPSFHRWLYAPAATGAAGNAYTYAYVDGDALVNPMEYGLHSSPLIADKATELIGEYVPPMIDEYGIDVDGAVAVNHGPGPGGASGVAVFGGFDATELRAESANAAENEESVETGAHAGHDLYFDEETGVAISHGTFVTGFSGDEIVSGRAVVEALIDARDGAATRLHEVDETAETLLRRQGERPIVFGAPAVEEETGRRFRRSPNETDDGADTDAPTVTGGGFSIEPDGDRLHYQITMITEQAVSDADAFGNGVPILDRFDEPSVTEDGVVLTYEATDGGRMEIDDRRSRPEARFDVDVNRGSVTVIHVGGDEIPADELAIVFEERDTERQIRWGAISNIDTIRTGDTVSVAVDTPVLGDELRLVWTPGSDVVHTESVPDRTGGRPNATFRTEFGTDAVSISHTGGDAIPAEELDVHVDSPDGDRVTNWTELDDSGTVTQGDTVTVDVSEADEGGRIRLVWTPDGTLLSDHPIAIDATPPNTTFDVGFDPGADTATVRHAAGDSIPADELELIVTGPENRSRPWQELSDDDVVRPGDAVTIDLSERDSWWHLAVWWTVADIDLESVRIPDLD
ncbi:hypothetical protein ACFOZ7_20300 [Natribaculum luteum]|uniref:Uncharacterized protein n=1 Tax=Natribaculum luteum TaxID=1586232 RepID=A0ABD5P519_9EURY|nr:hypothetical protein [Natribaculum luteum]